MKRGLFISFAMLASLLATPALAAPPMEVPEPSTADRAPAVAAQSFERFAQRQISPSEAKAIALRRVPGKVVDIRKTRDAYRVRIIRTDGRVVDVVVDAATGRVR